MCACVLETSTQFFQSVNGAMASPPNEVLAIKTYLRTVLETVLKGFKGACQ